MSYLMEHDNKQNKELEDRLLKECKLPNLGSDKVKGSRSRLIIPISDALTNSKQQHRSLLICDIQVSADGGVNVQFRHFDPAANSDILQAAQLVAASLYMVSIDKVLLKYCFVFGTRFADMNSFCVR